MRADPADVQCPTPGVGLGLADWGDRPALLSGHRSVSYAELASRVEDVSRTLGAGRRLVALEVEAAVEPVVVLLGALAGGHPVLLLAPGAARGQPALIDRYRPDVVCTAASGWRLSPEGREPRHELHRDLALLMSTSGSTGSPKLVRLSVENLEANARAIAEYLALTPEDRAITTLPLHYCYGLSVLTSHLVSGAGIVLSQASVVDPCFWEEVTRYEVTNLAGVPHTYALLDRAGFEHRSVPSLRFLTQAGGRLDPATVRRFAAMGAARGFDLFVMYGQTEATARMAYLPPELAAQRPEAIGQPVPGGRFRLDDGGDDDLGPGVGELVYAGPNVMLGYAEDARDLALGRTVDELRTGDLARQGPDGFYEIVGRRSRFLKLFGQRIDLGQVEALLADAGLDAVCTGDDEGLVVGHRTVDDGRDVADVARLALGLPRSALATVAYDDLPRLASGKPDLPAILADARRRTITDDPGSASSAAGSDAHGAPADPSHAGDAVRRLFAERLGVPVVADDDTFVGLGGDSLTYVEVSVELERLVGSLPPDWHHRSVAELEQRAGPAGRLAHLDLTVILRCVAIVAIVARHLGMAVAVAGGAHLLFAVSGYNVARFQLAADDRSDRARSLGWSIARIAIPAVAWLTAVALVNGRYGPLDVLLVDDPLAREANPFWRYWFVEALVQLLVVLTLVMAIPLVHRLDRRAPLLLPAAALAVLAVLYRSPALVPELRPWLVFMGPSVTCFVLGWLAWRARHRAARLVVSAAAVVVVPGLFEDPGREVSVTAGIVALAWVAAVPVPRPLVRVVGAVGGASLYIYLSHWQVYPLAASVLPVPVALVVVLAAGVVLWRLVDPVVRRVAGGSRAGRCRAAGGASCAAGAGGRRPRPSGVSLRG